MSAPKATYVYAVRVDGSRRYIGLGTKYRAGAHLTSARAILKGKPVKHCRYVAEYLAEAMKAGRSVDYEIIQDGLSQDQAKDLEHKLIKSEPGLLNRDKTRCGRDFGKHQKDASTMFSLHAILMPTGAPYPKYKVFFGKGQHSEEAVRSRLMPEHAGAEIMLGEPVTNRVELDVRFLVLLDSLRRDYPKVTGQWYPMDLGSVSLLMAAAARSMGEPPALSNSAEALASFRAHLGVDQGVMAAMLSCERTRVHRLEQGKAKFTFDDFRRLFHWSGRLGERLAFMAAFPLGPAAEAVAAPPLPAQLNHPAPETMQ